MNQYERQPSWRWQLVEELFRARKRVPHRFKQDAWLKDGCRFWNAFQKASESESRILSLMNVDAEFPSVSSAYTIYTGLGLERYFIEALIMADVPPQEIADHSGHTPRVVDCYEQLFFDVRRHLSKNVFIMGTVLGPLFHTTTGNDYDHLWKAVGYYCGPDALQALWTLGPIPDESYAKLTGILRNRLVTQATAASFARQPNSFNAGEIIENFISHGGLELQGSKLNNTDNSDKALDAIPQSIVQYAQLKLVPYDTPAPTREYQVGDTDNLSKDQYERPPTFEGTK